MFHLSANEFRPVLIAHGCDVCGHARSSELCGPMQRDSFEFITFLQGLECVEGLPLRGIFDFVVEPDARCEELGFGAGIDVIGGGRKRGIERGGVWWWTP